MRVMISENKWNSKQEAADPNDDDDDEQKDAVTIVFFN